MVADSIGIGFIGAGMVSELHARAIQRSSSARLVGVVDIDSDLAARRSREWSCRAFDTIDQLLADGEIEAVYVLTPTQLHVEHALVALEAGKHVLVEKPVSRSAQDVERLITVAQQTGLTCVPGHNYAYIPEYRRIKRLAERGELGTIRYVAVMFSIAHSEEVASHYDGITWLVMPHHAYLTAGLLGLPRRVTAGLTQPAWKTLDRADQGWIVLDYPPHTTAMLFTTLAVDDDSADPWTFVVKAVGTGGSASMSWRSAVTREALGSHSLGWVPYQEAYEAELAAFVSAVRGDQTQIASPMSDAIAVARIVGAAEASMREARTIDVAGRHESQ